METHHQSSGQPEQIKFDFNAESDEQKRARIIQEAEAALTPQQIAEGAYIMIKPNGEPQVVFPPEKGDQGYYK